MKPQSLSLFRCPATREPLVLDQSSIMKESEVWQGELISSSGRRYAIIEGTPDFLLKTETDKNDYALRLFKEKALEYDKYQHLSFETFYKKEEDVRRSMISRLNLSPGSKVLEVNAGTGRDSVIISSLLGRDGILHVQDISSEMLAVCRTKFSGKGIPIEFHRGNACLLPYQDQIFDAVYSFGGVGMNTYADNRTALAEMTRVCRPKGRIVYGGLSLAPWLRNTEFGKILANHNAHYLNVVKLEDLPVEARGVEVAWILEGAGFVVSFTRGEGEPSANFDYEIPGPRGGTLRTRYEGQLEGVRPETKELAQKARERIGVSMHEWLDALVRKEAIKVLNERKD